MLEWIAPGFVYALIKDAWLAIEPRWHHLTAAEILAKRDKWRKPFQEEIWRNFSEKLREDVIIHDIDRMRIYPKIDNRKGRVSSWFRSALLDTRNEGIIIWISSGTLTRAEGEDGWRFTRPDEDGEVEVVLAGLVPYEEIEHVDWHGDDCYYFPHIFCRYRQRGKNHTANSSFTRNARNLTAHPTT
jgi:hypothetical protein